MSEDDRPTGVDQTPGAALEAAYEAIGDAVHLTKGRPLGPGSGEGWQYPSDVYLCVGELTDIAAGLTQLIGQLSGALAEQYRAGHLSIEPEDAWAGNPRGALTAAFDAFETAARHANLMGTALAAAHSIAGAAEYTATPQKP